MQRESTEEHPALLGIGAALAEDPAVGHLYTRQQAALEAARTAAALSFPGMDAAAEAVKAYLASMRASA